MRRALGALPPILLAAFLLVLALSAPAWADPEDPAKPAESTTTAPTPQLRRFSPYAWPVLGLLAGQALAIALLVRAMRRRDRAERDRSASEQRYTDLLHSMLDGWGLSDMEGRTLQWNPAMRDMLGYTDQEMPLLTARHYTPPEDLEREIRDVLPQVLRRGYSDIYEKRVLHKTGRELHVELRVHLARDPEGRPAGIWSVVRDITARKRAEVELQRTYAEMEERVRTATAALETSQARLKAVLESTDDFIWAAETSGRVNYFNSAIHAHFLKHFNADLSQDDNPLGHLPPEKRALWQSVMRRCLAGESILNEYQLTNGQFVEIIANPIRDREGITGVSFFGRDVSERRRTRSRLRQTLAEVEAIFANSMVGILMVDGDRKVVRCNQRLAEILGYAHPGELEGKSARDSHLDDEHFDRFGQECYPPLRSMDRLHVDFPLRRRDGATVWCTLSGRAVDGKVPADLDKGVIWVVDDITTRRQSEQALRESEARFRAVVEGSPLAMSIVGPEERLEYINPRYVEMLGYPPEEIPDLPALRERVYPDPTYRQESYELLEAARNQLREGAPQGMMERRMVCRDGRALDVEFRFIDMGRDRILATLLDVTDRRRAEQLREDIDRILRHDLKSPVVGLIGLSRYLLDESLPADQRQMVEKIENNGLLMLRMIDHSLRLSRIEQGDYRPRLRALDLTSLLRELSKELLDQPHFAHHALTIQADGPVAVLGEEVLCQALFGNLVRNALEATSRQGFVRIVLDRDGDWGRVRIRNPEPVPEPVRERFFEKYATWGKTHGTGLGTYAARLMTRIQGGRIELRTGRDEGTELTVRLPLAPAPEATEA